MATKLSNQKTTDAVSNNNLKIRTTTISVFIKPEDQQDNIISAINKLLSFVNYESLDDKTKKRVSILNHYAFGFNRRKIKIIRIIIHDQRLNALFFKNMIKNLSESTRRTLVKQLNSRLDEKCNLYLRFDKYLANKSLQLIDGGACIHVKISFQSPYKDMERLKSRIISRLL